MLSTAGVTGCNEWFNISPPGINGSVGMCPEVYICIDQLKLKPEDLELDELYGVGLQYR